MRTIALTVTTVPETVEEFYAATREYFTRPGATLAKEKGYCRYRHKDGAKCAVGCHIPDELYTPEFEHKGLDGLINVAKETGNPLAEVFSGEDVLTFLKSAQILHDNIANDAAEFVTLLDGAFGFYCIQNGFGVHPYLTKATAVNY